MAAFHIVTFGCRVNQADTASIRSALCSRGFVESVDPRDCAVLVVNSCTVTHRSDQQVRQMVRRLHRANPGARLIVTGCYAQRAPESVAQIPGVNFVVGNTDKENFFGCLEPAGTRDDQPLVVISDFSRKTLRATPALLTGGKTRPHVKIQDGCDARCSYCVIPMVRGPGRSVEPLEIVEQVRGLARAGHSEVVLTGVHMGTYGRKLKRPSTLVELLGQIAAIPELKRLRLSSIEPMHFSPEIIELAASTRKIARHFHLPLQSGSQKILRAMRRPYRPLDFARILEQIVNRIPDACLGTDVICGFPGETDQDFSETLDFLSCQPLAYIHTFPYSERADTESARLPDKVQPGLRKERCHQVLVLSRQKRGAFNRRFVGSRLSAVTLSDLTPDGHREALSDNYIPLKLEPTLAADRLVTARAIRAEGDYLIGDCGLPIAD